jgi:hypothetical protein
VRPFDDHPAWGQLRLDLGVRLHRPAFGRHGRKIVAALCAWELVALVPGSVVPTLSQTVRRSPAFGWSLLVLLAHHWFIEAVEVVLIAPQEGTAPRVAS